LAVISSSAFPVCHQALPPGRVPLDKEKGVVKGKDILSGAEHRFLWTPERVWDRDSEISPLHHFFWWIAPPSHRYDQNYDHDFFIRTPSRRVCAEVGNTGGVFQGACAVFCTDRSGCESTRSTLRARHLPGAPAGCSRYERSPDSRHCCVASSRVAQPICEPPPPWPLL
jgi:hypothetical protein